MCNVNRVEIASKLKCMTYFYSPHPYLHLHAYTRQSRFRGIPSFLNKNTILILNNIFLFLCAAFFLCFLVKRSAILKEHRPTCSHPNAAVRLSFYAFQRRAARCQQRTPRRQPNSNAAWRRLSLSCLIPSPTSLFNIAIYIEIIFNIFIDISQ